MSDLVDRFRKYIKQEQELPHVFRGDQKATQQREQEWAALKRFTLEAEGARIWRKPSHRQ